MAVAFDAVGPGATGVATTASPISWTHTLVSGVSSVVLAWVTVDISFGNVDTGYTITCTCGGVSMTPVGTVHANSSNVGFGTLFQLTGVAAGAKTITATAAGGTNLDNMSGSSLSFTGVNQVAPFGPVTTNTGTGTTTYTTATATLPASTSGNLVAGFVVAGSAFSSATAPSTSRSIVPSNGTTGGGGGFSATATSPSTGSAVTMAWTISAADYFGELVAELQVLHSTGGQDPFMPQGLTRMQARRRKNAQRPQFNIQSPSVNIHVSTIAAVAAIPLPAPPFLTQVLGTGQTQYLADQYGAPYCVRGDSLWALVNNAGYAGGATTWQSDINLYFSTRSSQGYNCVILDCLCSAGEGLTVTHGTTGATWDNVVPFTGGVPGTLNNTFWQRIDLAVSTAAQYGITLFLNPVDKYAFDAGNSMASMTSAQATAYGTALAARYATSANIVWFFGNDYSDTQTTNYNNILTALRAGGANQLCTIENLTEGDSRFSDNANTAWSWGTSNAQFNFVYTYGGNYPCINYAYLETSPLCVLLGDGFYDGTGSGTLPSAPRDFMRLLVWWALSSGSRGYIYGDQSLISWNPHTALTTTPFATTDLNLIWNQYSSLPGWHQLVPDTSNALITANRGTALPTFPSNTAGFYTGFGGGGTNLGSRSYYVTASITPTGSLAVIYMPDATGANTGGAISVNGSLMQSGYTAAWMDPATGVQTPTTVASTYSHSGANSQGAADWVLVLAAPTVGAVLPELNMAPRISM